MFHVEQSIGSRYLNSSPLSFAFLLAPLMIYPGSHKDVGPHEI